MITCIKNNQGYIFSYLEWDLIDDNGEMSPNAGMRWNFFVKHIWVHPDFNFMECLRIMAHIIVHNPCFKDVRFVVWERRSRDNRVRRYILHKILKRIFGSVQWNDVKKIPSSIEVVNGCL